MRALIADDEELVRYGIRDMLSEISVPVTVVGEAENGSQLVEMCRNLRPDLAIVDVRMPKMGGLEAIELARREGHPIEWIVLTSYSDFEYARTAMRLGACEYLLKPVGPEELDEALRRAAERRAQQWAADNERFETRIASLLGGQGLGSADYETGNWIYAVTLVLVDSPLSDERVKILRNSASASLKAALSDLVGAALRLGVVAVESDRLVVVLGWDIAFHESDSHESLKDRFEGRLARALFGFTGPEHRSTALVSETLPSLAEVVSQVNRLARLASLRALSGFGGLIKLTEVARIAALSGAESMAARLEGAIASWKAGRPLAFGDSLKEARAIYLQRPALRVPGISHTIERYLSFFLSNIAGSLDTLDDWLPPLFGDLLDRRPAEGGGGAIADQVMRYLEENYMRNVSIAKIATSLGLTPNYLSALFHKRAGTTFTTYLTRVRMERARELLLGSNRTVGEVASAVGYTSARHFARTFKTTFDHYPSELRRDAGR